MSNLDSTTPTALVTGGSRGIGRAVALTLARDGYQVILTYVSRPEEADKTVAEIEAAGGRALALPLNVGDGEAVAAFFAEHIKGKVNLAVLVNNAGITKDGFLVRMKDDDFDRVITINLRGAFICTREAAKIMTKARHGRIVNISSVVGQMGNAGPGQLQRRQGRPAGSDQVLRQGTGRAPDHGQCRGPRIYRNRHDRRPERRCARLL